MTTSSDTVLGLRGQASRLHSLLNDADDLGYFGPRSAMWFVSREAVMSLGLGRALLMQIAHPWVAQAVQDHSDVATHPIERLIATATAAEILVFGSRSQADATAEQICQVHRRVRGTLPEDVGRWRRGDEYRADDQDALLWVLATLVDTSLVVHEACFGRLPEQLVREYLRDAACLGEMLGIPAARVPEDRGALTCYVARMIRDGTVAVGATAQNLADQLYGLPLVNTSGKLWRGYRGLSVGIARSTLPEPLRRQYGIAPGWRERLVHRAAGRAARIIVQRVPAALRVDPVTRRAILRAQVLQKESSVAPDSSPAGG